MCANTGHLKAGWLSGSATQTEGGKEGQGRKRQLVEAEQRDKSTGIDRLIEVQGW